MVIFLQPGSFWIHLLFCTLIYLVPKPRLKYNKSEGWDLYLSLSIGTNIWNVVRNYAGLSKWHLKVLLQYPWLPSLCSSIWQVSSARHGNSCIQSTGIIKRRRWEDCESQRNSKLTVTFCLLEKSENPNLWSLISTAA